MEFKLNSTQICGKWKIIKQLFYFEDKIFVHAVSEMNFKRTECTLILMIYDETKEQTLLKTIQRLQATYKENSNIKLLVPEKPMVEIIGKSKMYVMSMKQKPINVNWMLKVAKYSFTAKQIIEAAIYGITSLSELHSLNLLHGRINTKTCYFYNRQQKVHFRKTAKTQVITYFGLNVIDIQKFSAKGFNTNDRVEEILYEPYSKGIGLKPSYKQDVQSLIYVLIKMATGNQIFSCERYYDEWTNDDAIRKWKINQLYLQMLNKIPQNLSILIQLYLCIQQQPQSQKPDYSYLLKKLWKQKQTNLIKQSEQTKQTRKNKLMTIIQPDGLPLVSMDDQDSQDQIFDKNYSNQLQQNAKL